ncbi:MAG: DUF4956 domain-containing protein [Gemmatimonadota bacterium]
MNGDSRIGKQRARSIPLLGLLGYYVLLVGLGGLLIWLVPGARLAISAPIEQGAGAVGELVTGRSSAMSSEVGATPWPGPIGRLALASFAAIGALLLALPVAWVHMFTRRLRYDPSLVQAIIILPIVVAGVVLVVKNSLALAFALAGIVAGVRFRQKLNEPQDAVYVLLALGIGLAAGVQALDVALAVSLIFNVAGLALWRYDLAAIYAPGRYAVLATGDTSLTIARREGDVHEIRSEVSRRVPDMNLDGILVVHTLDADAARHAVDMSLSGLADEWHHFEPVAGRDGLTRLKIAVKLEEGEDPVDLLGELEERWSAQIVAAEYIPHRVRKRKKKKQQQDDTDDDDDD